MSILALDPGLEYPAAALYSDRLMCAERVPLPGHLAKLDLMDRVDRIAESIVDWCLSQPWTYNHPTLMIAELPQIYGGGRGKGDPNKLLPLAMLCSAVLARLRPSCTVLNSMTRQPGAVWGNLPKTTKGDPWKSPRGIRLAQRLRPEERAVVQDKHDALDAAGLALYAAGRWKARKTYSGAV